MRATKIDHSTVKLWRHYVQYYLLWVLCEPNMLHKYLTWKPPNASPRGPIIFNCCRSYSASLAKQPCRESEMWFPPCVQSISQITPNLCVDTAGWCVTGWWLTTTGEWVGCRLKEGTSPLTVVHHSTALQLYTAHTHTHTLWDCACDCMAVSYVELWYNAGSTISAITMLAHKVLCYNSYIGL